MKPKILKQDSQLIQATPVGPLAYSEDIFSDAIS